MNSKKASSNKVGVIGAGNFGTAVANLLAINNDVLLYTRKLVSREEHAQKKAPLADNVQLTSDLKGVTERCDVLYLIVPAAVFREVTQQLAPFLREDHILIHGTKGLDVRWPEGSRDTATLTREEVKTMGEILLEETCVQRIGCISGPNLAGELAERQPAATVLASTSDEVIRIGQKLLRSDLFQVYSSHDRFGTELCGVLKNIFAIVAGASRGLGHGENAKAFLISRGIVEMVYIGKALGATIKPFVGLSGIGDLVATCSSPLSRNHTVGYRLAKGEKLPDVLKSMGQVAEGISTVRVVRNLMKHYNMRVPITELTYRILFEDLDMNQALQYLMKYPFNVDVNFL